MHHPTRRLVAALLFIVTMLACTSRPATTGSSSSGSPTTAPVESPAPSPSSPPPPSASSGSSPIPIPSLGVVPADADGFAGVVARSLVAVIRGGNVEFVDRILQDAQSSSTCTPLPDIHVLSKPDAGMERALVRRAIRTAQALDRVDGVGHARGRMNRGAAWPGLADPFLVAVVVAIDCPEE